VIKFRGPFVGAKRKRTQVADKERAPAFIHQTDSMDMFEGFEIKAGLGGGDLWFARFLDNAPELAQSHDDRIYFDPAHGWRVAYNGHHNRGE
jgi:hypothetical protein